MKRLSPTLVIGALVLCAHAQSFREQFTEANLLTEDGFYGLAIPYWEALIKERDNANLQYKLGRCYLSLELDRDKALPFLRKAARGVERIYDPYSSDFEGAPLEAYFYLGKAYHIHTQLDSAEEYYTRFLADAGKKHFLRPEAEKALEMCANAREFIAYPVEATIRNIGSPINSPFAEYAPIVALDENTLYFTSRRLRTDGSNQDDIEMRTGYYYEDMYVSFRNLQGDWMNPELLTINLPNAHSSVVSMSPDGKTIYIYKTHTGDGNLYESTFEMGTGWTEPNLIGSDVNSKDNEFFAAITSDNQRLYFVSDRPGGLGGKDIWYCNRLPNGDWGKAINAGTPINTPFDEDSPYIHPNGKTIYFASNGHKSMGGYDIFMSTIQNEQWSKPVNLGYPINTTDDDHSYVGTPSGRRAYYSSKGSGSIGSTDIYVIEYPEEAEQAPEVDMSDYAILKGWVLTPSGNLPSDLKVTVSTLSDSDILGEARPVIRNGSFVFIIPSGAAYQVDYSLGDRSLISEVVSIPSGQKYQELSREIILTPNKLGKMEAIAINANAFQSGHRLQLLKTDGHMLPIGSRIMFLDQANKPLDSVYVSKDGFFEYSELAQQPGIQLVPEAPGLNLQSLSIILESDASQTEPYERTDHAFVQPTSKSKYADETQKIRTKEQLTTKSSMRNEFAFYFGYNQTAASVQSTEFQSLIDGIKLRIDQGKTFQIVITGSASKVPTKSFESNETLAMRRAEAFENQLLKALKSAGIDANKISTIQREGIVSGPEYSAATRGQKRLFADFQYVKIILN
jgi:hypothetical protein